MKAVRLERFGGLEVLAVVDAERPVPGPGTVLVEVRAAGIQPGEVNIRTGALAAIYPSTFPHGQLMLVDSERLIGMTSAFVQRSALPGEQSQFRLQRGILGMLRRDRR